jgi:hypothetical protein
MDGLEITKQILHLIELLLEYVYCGTTDSSCEFTEDYEMSFVINLLLIFLISIETSDIMGE